MNTNDLKPNIYGLQQDVLNLLGNVSKLMGDVKETLSGDNSGEKYGDYQQDIDNAVVNVKELELRMAVVAPMKAGKSTIINAIVGDDLLPSRNAAMTTIPTEIILKKELTQPILILSEHIRKVFKGCYIALKEKIQKLKIEKTLEEKTGQYPHLRELIEEIYNLTENELPNFLDSEKIEGKENIGKALTSLNDIIRLVSILDPNFDPIQKLREVPRIETGFCQISENGNQSEQFGNLVIIDTPGPNEAGENLKLSYVVENQLEKSSVVLIVLDFTQLNNKAAEDVKRQVKPIIDLRGKENLYVLVNKVDQRRDGDMTPNIVKQFVFNDLKLSESENTDKVFEISARKAFCANRFLLDLQNQDIDTKQKASIMPSSKTLAQEVFGMDWEEDLEEVTIKQLQKKANKLKEKSGFNIFLSQTISVLMENAAPKCLKSSLNIAYNHLISVRDEVKLRGSAIAQDEEKLRLEIEALEADLKRLELCRTKLQEVDKIKAKLEQQLNLILDDLKKDALVKIEMFYSEEEYNQADWREKGEKSIKNVVSWVAKQIGAKIDSEKKQTILEFETEQKAQQFIGNTIAFGKQRTESHLLNVRKKVQVIIENKRNELAKSVEEAKPIIEKAKQRLKETFDVDLELRSPTFSSNQNLNLNYIKATSKTRNIDQGYDTVSYQQRHWWHWAWIVPKEYTKKVKKADKKVAYYTVSLEEITLQFNDSLETSIKSMNQEIAKYLDEDFKHRIDNYFEKLDAYLTNYRDDIKQAQKDQKLSLEEQTKLTDKLNSIIPQVNEKVEESQKLTEIINELIK